MPGEAIDCLEGAGIKERFNPLHGGHFAFGVLLVDGFLSSSGRLLPAGAQYLCFTRRGVVVEVVRGHLSSLRL
jgi:hypothetical protein